MPSIFFSGYAYNNVAKAMGIIYKAIEEISFQRERNIINNNYVKELEVLAFIARKDILDKMEKYNWSMTTSIYIESISRHKLTLFYAYSQTVGKLQLLAEELGCSIEVNEVINKGSLYYKIEKITSNN